ISPASFAAEKTITWQDAISCDYSIKFDLAKYDEERLKNTVDVLFVTNFYEYFLRVPAPPNQLTLEEVQRACSRTIATVTKLPVIDLPGIEQYRASRLEDLNDQCRFNEALARAGSGEPEALREYPKSVAQCGKFIDALEGKTDIKSVWRDMVNSYCA